VLGDGATNPGVFYEALNLASLHALPLLLVIEDNGVAIGTAYDRSCRVSIPAKLADIGVAKIFTPGASTHEIVDWVESYLRPKVA
jgi:TPP-dependent pyruvate/acetoin dehydrogenase alpha subunit